MTEIVLKPIGVVRSDYRESKDVPRLGGPAAVEVFAEYADALYRLEKHSHLWVMAWLDQADRDRLQVIPRGAADGTEADRHGVFAVRSPVRPNPIGLSLARIVGIDGRRIELDRLDFMDSTPVVDLKPYFLSRDAVFAARNEQIGQPADRAALRESLRMQALNFNDDQSPDTELAVDIYTDFRADILQMVEPRMLTVWVPLNRPWIIDAFIGMTRATPGRGTLQFGLEDVIRMVWENGMVEYELLPGEGFRRVREEGPEKVQ